MECLILCAPRNLVKVPQSNVETSALLLLFDFRFNEILLLQLHFLIKFITKTNFFGVSCPWTRICKNWLNEISILKFCKTLKLFLCILTVLIEGVTNRIFCLEVSIYPMKTVHCPVGIPRLEKSHYTVIIVSVEFLKSVQDSNRKDEELCLPLFSCSFWSCIYDTILWAILHVYLHI